MKPAPHTAMLDELNRQVERGHLFAHTAMGETHARMVELQATVHGLMDTLLRAGLVDPVGLGEAIAAAADELQARGEDLGPGTRIRVDDPAQEPPTARVDCEARLPLCHAACCRLNFALSVPEIEAGHARWDLGQPYFIRKQADGRCTHLSPSGCGIYAQRPAVCRRYDCSHDARIWTDFEGRVLNTAWIEAHLGPAAPPRAEAVRMHFHPPRAPAGDRP
jgi:hypothetical protein